ncbi:MAG: hypothetical protein ACI86S_002695, partial [Paracoccaceae bacterium]
PQARNYLGDIADRAVSYVGPADNGFAQFSLRFDAA